MNKPKRNQQGLARGMTLQDVANKHGVKLSYLQKQLDAGIQVQRQHSQDPNKQKKTSMDHLSEDPNYYVKLKKYVQSYQLKQSIKRKIKIKLIQRRYIQKIPTFAQYKKNKPNRTEKDYQRRVIQFQDRNWYSQRVEQKKKEWANREQPIPQKPIPKQQFFRRQTDRTQKDYRIYLLQLQQRNWMKQHWWELGQEYKRKMNKQKQPRMQQSINKFKGRMEQDVGAVAGYNGPGKKIKQNAAGDVSMVPSGPVRDSKGNGIAKKTQQRSMQTQAIVFEQDQDQIFNIPEDMSDQQGQLDKYPDFADQDAQGGILQFGDEYQQQQIGLLSDQQLRKIQREEKIRQQMEEQDIDDMFEDRTQRFGRAKKQMPIASQQRTQHSASQNMQTNWVVPQAKKVDKQTISQGLDFQQMYDLMQSYMIQDIKESFNLNPRKSKGINHDYDVR